MRLWRWIAAAAALAVVAFSLVNASWLAARPDGRLVLVSQGGIDHPLAAGAAGPCAAVHIQPPGDNDYIEDSLPAIYKATRIGADAVAIPVRRTSDGRMVAFADSDLDCRTDGHGPLAARSLAELKALDIGYGYTADGGRSFPLRGRGRGGMPTVEEVLREVPATRLVFVLAGSDPKDADALAAEFGRAGVPIDDKYGFRGDPAVTARIRALAPAAWTYGEAELRGPCLSDYRRTGWTGLVPQSCANRTIALTLDERWALWGWPYRFLARMAKVHAKVMIFRAEENGRLAGLDRPEQYDEVPADFRGTIWAEDFATMGPALRR